MTNFFSAIYLNNCVQIHTTGTKVRLLFDPRKSTHSVFKGLSNLDNQDCISSLRPEAKYILSSVSKLAHTELNLG